MANPTIIEFPIRGTESVPNAAEEGLAPLVAIGGLLTIKQLYPLYNKLLKLDTSSALPAWERFIPPPHRGLGPVEATRVDLNEVLKRKQEQLDAKVALVGHSLGALLATMAVLDNPEIVASVTLLAGAHEGIKDETWASRALRQAVGNPPEAQLLRHDSGFMKEHKDRIATEWPEDVPLHIISTSLDVLIRPPHGFGLQPQGQQAQKRLVVPSLPGMEYLAHRIPGIEHLTRRILGDMPKDVELLYSTYPTEHTNIVRSPVVLNYIDANRRATSDYSEAAMVSPLVVGLDGMAISSAI